MRKGNGAIKAFGQRIAELLKEEPANVGRRRSEPAERAAGAGIAGVADARQLVEHVQSVLGERGTLAIGRVSCVDLDRIRARAGARWPRIADRVDAIVRRAIERRLEATDLYTPVSEHRYLISFGRLSTADAGLKAAMIGEEINRLLIGEDLDGEMIKIQTAAATVDASLPFEVAPNVQRLVEALAELPGQTDRLVTRSAPVTPSVDDDPLADVQLVYQPMWDVRRNVVSTFRYLPAVPRARGKLAVGESAIPGIDDPKVLQLLDARTMSRALADLVQLVSTRRKLLLVVPLHFETVATSSRLTAYAKLCRAVPSDLQQLLIFELVDVPVGIPQSRLLDLTTMLKRYGRSVLLRLPLVDPPFRPAAETGVSVVGASLTGLRLRELQLMRAFDRFCEGAQRTGLNTYVHGLRTLSLTTAAVGAGFDYVDGDVVTSVVDEPSGIYRFDARTMVRNWAIGNI